MSDSVTYRTFLIRKVQSLYQCRAPHPEHGLEGGKYFCLFFDSLLLVGYFVSIFSVLEMVNFSNTINYLAT